jgi:hypothetical protein
MRELRRFYVKQGRATPVRDVSKHRASPIGAAVGYDALATGLERPKGITQPVAEEVERDDHEVRSRLLADRYHPLLGAPAKARPEAVSWTEISMTLKREMA